MKKSAILASAIAAVMAGTAVAETTLYGRARMAYVMIDDQNVDPTSTTTPPAYLDQVGITDVSSRFGLKVNEDLGNGMSAIARFELGYDADDNAGSAVSNRIGTVGVKGDFGSVTVGNDWIPSYKHTRGAFDPFNFFGIATGYLQGSRYSDQIQYMGDFGGIKLGVSVFANDSATEDDAMDGNEISAVIPAGPVTIHIATQEDPVERTLTTATGTDMKNATHTSAGVFFADGPITAGLALLDTSDEALSSVAGALAPADVAALSGLPGFATGLSTDFEATVLQFTYKVGMGNFLINFADFEATVATLGKVDGDNTIIGYHHNLSKRTSLFVENQSGDLNEGTALGIKHNF